VIAERSSTVSPQMPWLEETQEEQEQSQREMDRKATADRVRRAMYADQEDEELIAIVQSDLDQRVADLQNDEWMFAAATRVPASKR